MQFLRWVPINNCWRRFNRVLWPMGSPKTDALAVQFDALSKRRHGNRAESPAVTLTAATLHDAVELEAWLQEAKTVIEAALQEGPVIL